MAQRKQARTQPHQASDRRQKAARYDHRQAGKNAAARTVSAAGREIGEIPAVVDHARRAAAEHDFRRFAETYLPATFSEFNWGCIAGCTLSNCNCTAPGYYWSSSTYRLNPTAAWYVNFYVGTLGATNKGDTFYARAVRSGL